MPQFSIIVFGFLLSRVLFGQQPTPSTEPIPQGWYAYPNSKLKHVDETSLRCFNRSPHDWQVSIEGDDIRIMRLSGRKGDVPSLPPLLKVQPGMPGQTVTAGLSGAMHFAKGWLLAYDSGEFGGGLWLTNEDGSETKWIISDNVRAVVPLDGSGILVLSGLMHMSTDFGNEFIFSNPDGLNMALQRSTHLDGAPMAYTELSDGSVLFVTTHSLHAISKSKSPKTLDYVFPNWVKAQYPNSIAARTDGTIFIGMRMFVLRLTPTATGYDEVWLLPNSCRKFWMQHLSCNCRL